MKASLVLVLFASLLSVCVSYSDDTDYAFWDGVKCDELIYDAADIDNDSQEERDKKTSDMKAACWNNKEWVDKRRKLGDFSVTYSTYMRESRQSFVELFTMDELKFSGVSPDLSGIPEFDRPILNVWDGEENEQKRQRMIDSLDTVLETHYRIYNKKSDYVVYAAIDLMNLVYTKEFDTDGRSDKLMTWRFSAEMVRQALAPREEYNNAKLVFEYLREEGVCLEEDYIIQGTACRRFYIGNYYRLLDMTNQGIVDKLESGHPVYVQVALNPNFYQFHSPSAEDPVGRGFHMPTYAGVTTGFNFTTEGKEYWKVYIRRHELHPELTTGYHGEKGSYNYVRVATKFQDDEGVPLNPFAGITSMGYTIDVDVDDRDRDMIETRMLELKLAEFQDSIMNEDELLQAVLESIREYYGEEQNPEKYLPEIKALYIHPGCINATELVANDSPLNLTSVLPNLHTIALDLDSDGEWLEDYPYAIVDFYDFDVNIMNRDYLHKTNADRRRLGDYSNNKKNYPYGDKTPGHPNYKYNGRTFPYHDYHFDGLIDRQKSHHIKVTGKLRSLVFGRYTMPFMPLFVMHSPNLKFIYASDYSFYHGWYIRIEGCPALEQISFGLHTFSDGWDPVSIPNKVHMDWLNLPRLDTMLLDFDAAFNIRNVTCCDVGNRAVEFTLVEDRAFPNQKDYQYDKNNHPDVDDYFRRIFKVATPAPEEICPGGTCVPFYNPDDE